MTRHAPRRLRAAALCLAFASGCANFDGIVPHARRIDPERLAAQKKLAGAALTPAAWPTARWWEALGDAQLDALIAEALAGNPGMGVLRARIERARALAAGLGAATTPQVNAGASATRQRYSANGIFPPPIAGSWRTQSDLGVSASVDFDLWDRHRAAQDAALGQARAAEVDAQSARLLLATQVARTYAQLARSFEQRELARDALNQRVAWYELTEKRVAAGLDSEAELNQVEGTLPAARQRVTQYEEEIALGRNLLAALAGRGPDRGLEISRPQLNPVAPAIPAMLPADLLGRRPDIVAQRWRVEAALRDIDAAKAQFYPNLNLNALLGLQSVRLGKLLSAQSENPAFGPALRLPLFDGGRLRANLAARDAEHDAAVEQYNQLVIEALRDVVDQLDALASVHAQQSDLEASLASARRTRSLALERWRAGTTSYLPVLAAETGLTEQLSLAANLRARALDLSINLIRALGGGYVDADSARAS